MSKVFKWTASRSAAQNSELQPFTVSSATCDGSRRASQALISSATARSAGAMPSITATSPPGLHTRAISRTAWPGSLKWCGAIRHVTRSNLPAG